MLALLETVIAFLVIMVILTHAVKGLTSLIKTYFDYYSKNLKWEVRRLLEASGKKFFEQNSQGLKVFESYNWKRLGEEFLTQDNICLLADRMGFDSNEIKTLKQRLDSRLSVHIDNLRFNFERYNKRIAMVVGFVLCLGLNINAINLWNQLNTDQILRQAFVNQASQNQMIMQAQSLSQSIDEYKEKSKDQTGKELNNSFKELNEDSFKYIEDIQEKFSFGAGRVYGEVFQNNKDNKHKILLFEILGSLFTAILLSVGAPYWHELLRNLMTVKKYTIPKSQQPPKKPQQ